MKLWARACFAASLICSMVNPASPHVMFSWTVPSNSIPSAGTIERLATHRLECRSRNIVTVKQDHAPPQDRTDGRAARPAPSPPTGPWPIRPLAGVPESSSPLASSSLTPSALANVTPPSESTRSADRSAPHCRGCGRRACGASTRTAPPRPDRPRSRPAGSPWNREAGKIRHDDSGRQHAHSRHRHVRRETRTSNT